jgi:hypothetical protein
LAFNKGFLKEHCCVITGIDSTLAKGHTPSQKQTNQRTICVLTSPKAGKIEPLSPIQVVG